MQYPNPMFLRAFHDHELVSVATFFFFLVISFVSNPLSDVLFIFSKTRNKTQFSKS